jgi:hypothetical protein
MPSSKTKQTFDVRMGCDNCGHTNIYTLPLRSRVYDCRNRDEDDLDVSAYSKVGNKDQTMLFCVNCRLPKLTVFWWLETPEDAMHPERSN